MLAVAATRSMGVALMPPLLIEAELASGELVVAATARCVASGRITSSARAGPATGADHVCAVAADHGPDGHQRSQDRRVGAGDRLTSVDGRVLGVTASLAVIDPAAPLPTGTHCTYPDAPIAVIARSHRACTVVSFSFRTAHFALVACVLFLQGLQRRSELAYNQAPAAGVLAAEQLFQPDRSPGRPFAQRTGRPHQWHRDQMLPQACRLLQQVQQRLADDITTDQRVAVCMPTMRLQIDQLIAQVGLKLVVLASQLTESQIRNFENNKQTAILTGGRSGWILPADRLAAHRFKLLLSRAEGWLWCAAEPQKAACAALLPVNVRSPAQLRRTPAPAKDLAQVLRQIASDPASTAERSRACCAATWSVSTPHPTGLPGATPKLVEKVRQLCPGAPRDDACPADEGGCSL